MERAERLMGEMEELYDSDPGGSGVRPNSFAYTALINALAKGGGGAEAAGRAEDVLRRMVDLSRGNMRLTSRTP